MTYLQLLRHSPRTLGFGFLQAFFSGPGQTHFISLYTPIIMTSFALSATEYGSLYSLITLISGFSISVVGPWIDRYDVRYFSLGVGLGLTVSLFLLAPLNNIWMVAAGLFGLRLFGQGLCSSLSSITVARYFNKGRGKALSLSQLGFPAFEGLITPLGAYLLSYLSFQEFMTLTAISVALVYLPLSFFLTTGILDFNRVTEIKESRASDSENNLDENWAQSWTRRQVFTNKQVYFLIPHTLMPPFALTGLFFHQALIAESKNWPLTLMATSFSFLLWEE
jgi:MFS family permease